MFRNGTLCDVIIKSQDGNEINAHKCVLVSNSEYFDKMFTGTFQETTKDVVQINDISSNALNTLIDFMYTGESIAINSDNVDVNIFLFISTRGWNPEESVLEPELLKY